MIDVMVQQTRVPALGYGTWLLNDRECLEGVEHALALGYRHVDTAQGYDNEEQVGEALVRSGVPREEIFLTTKVRPSNFHHEAVLRSSRESLKKLRTDYVDLLLLHWPNPEVPLAATLEALRTLQDEGATRHIGVSNFPPSLVDEARQHAEIFCNQVEYHPYLSQEKLLAQARASDYLLTAYCPIARGKVLADPALQEIGARHGKSPVQVTLRWLIQQDNVAAIPKAASREHRVSNIEIFDFELSDEEMARIFSLGGEARLVNPDDGPDWER